MNEESRTSQLFAAIEDLTIQQYMDMYNNFKAAQSSTIQKLMNQFKVDSIKELTGNPYGPISVIFYNWITNSNPGHNTYFKSGGLEFKFANIKIVIGGQQKMFQPFGTYYTLAGNSLANPGLLIYQIGLDTDGNKVLNPITEMANFQPQVGITYVVVYFPLIRENIRTTMFAMRNADRITIREYFDTYYASPADEELQETIIANSPGIRESIDSRSELVNNVMNNNNNAPVEPDINVNLETLFDENVNNGNATQIAAPSGSVRSMLEDEDLGINTIGSNGPLTQQQTTMLQLPSDDDSDVEFNYEIEDFEDPDGDKSTEELIEEELTIKAKIMQALWVALLALPRAVKASGIPDFIPGANGESWTPEFIANFRILDYIQRLPALGDASRIADDVAPAYSIANAVINANNAINDPAARLPNPIDGRYYDIWGLLPGVAFPTRRTLSRIVVLGLIATGGYLTMGYTAELYNDIKKASAAYVDYAYSLFIDHTIPMTVESKIAVLNSYDRIIRPFVESISDMLPISSLLYCINDCADVVLYFNKGLSYAAYALSVSAGSTPPGIPYPEYPNNIKKMDPDNKLAKSINKANLESQVSNSDDGFLPILSAATTQAIDIIGALVVGGIEIGKQSFLLLLAAGALAISYFAGRNK